EDATAGNVRGTLPTHRVELLQIRPVGLEQDLAQWLAQLREHPLQRNVFEDLAHQRKAIRVEADRGEADEAVARAAAARVRPLTAFDPHPRWRRGGCRAEASTGPRSDRLRRRPPCPAWPRSEA